MLHCITMIKATVIKASIFQTFVVYVITVTLLEYMWERTISLYSTAHLAFTIPKLKHI